MRRLLLVLAVLVALLVVALPAVLSGADDPGPEPSAAATAEIPAELLVVYRDAAARYCSGLSWPVLAAVGWVESRHGGGRVDAATGEVRPPIVGPPLDGTAGRMRLADPTSSDGWAHAEGPMQFLSSTWRAWAVLAPGRPAGAAPDANNAWDAIHTAARYLCGGADTIADLEAALWRYNRSSAYAEDVLDKASEYQAIDAPAGGSGTAAEAVAFASTMVGVPYRWGGQDPSGFDCSGLVWWAYRQAGVTVPRTTTGQVTAGRAVSVDELEPGDLLFTRGGPAGAVRDLGHVAIYAGGGYEIVAPATGRDVTIRPVDATRVQAARRLIG